MPAYPVACSLCGLSVTLVSRNRKQISVEPITPGGPRKSGRIAVPASKNEWQATVDRRLAKCARSRELLDAARLPAQLTRMTARNLSKKVRSEVGRAHAVAVRHDDANHRDRLAPEFLSAGDAPRHRLESHAAQTLRIHRPRDRRGIGEPARAHEPERFVRPPSFAHVRSLEERNAGIKQRRLGV